MAGHVLRAGFPLTVFNRTRSKAEPLRELGATVADTPAALGMQVDCVLICAGDGASVKELLLGKDGAAEKLAPGSIVVDHTTIAPAEAEELGRLLAAKRLSFLDAPVTGGDKGARLGKLTTMVGGTPEVFEKMLPVLNAFSGRVIRIGEIGYGQRMKAVNQICALLNSITLSEAFNFASGLGLDLQQCFEVLQGGAANSWALENFGPRIISGDFSPGFSVRHSRKDIYLVLAEAERAGLQLSLSPKAREALDRAHAKGFDDLGNHSIFRIFQESS